jgi:hypothetical protein
VAGRSLWREGKLGVCKKMVGRKGYYDTLYDRSRYDITPKYVISMSGVSVKYV